MVGVFPTYQKKKTLIRMFLCVWCFRCKISCSESLAVSVVWYLKIWNASRNTQWCHSGNLHTWLRVLGSSLNTNTHMRTVLWSCLQGLRRRCICINELCFDLHCIPRCSIMCMPTSQTLKFQMSDLRHLTERALDLSLSFWAFISVDMLKIQSLPFLKWAFTMFTLNALTEELMSWRRWMFCLIVQECPDLTTTCPVLFHSATTNDW